MEGEEFTSISESKLIEIISSDDLAVNREDQCWSKRFPFLCLTLEIPPYFKLRSLLKLTRTIPCMHNSIISFRKSSKGKNLQV